MDTVKSRNSRLIWQVAGFVGLGAAVLAGIDAWSWFGLGEDPNELWTEANRAVEMGRFDTLEKDLARLARLRKPTPSDTMLSAQLMLSQRRPDKAIAELLAIPEDHRFGSQAKFQIGQIELRRHRLRLAEWAFLEAIRLEPTAVRPRRELVYIYGMQSRWNELAKQFRELGKVTPLSVDDLILWCLSRSLSWRAEEITDDLRRFVEADPTDRWSRLALAENLSRRQFLDEAEQVVSTLSLDDADVRAFRAKLALDRGEVDRAEELLKAGPGEHPALARLRGKLALQRRDGEEALRQFKKSLESDPAHRETLNGMAQSLLMLGRADEAKPYQQLTKDYDALGILVERLASRSFPREPAFYKRLAEAYEKVERFEEARAWFRLVVTLNPLDTAAQRSLYRLRSEELPSPAP